MRSARDCVQDGCSSLECAAFQADIITAARLEVVARLREIAAEKLADAESHHNGWNASSSLFEFAAADALKDAADKLEALVREGEE